MTPYSTIEQTRQPAWTALKNSPRFSVKCFATPPVGNGIEAISASSALFHYLEIMQVNGVISVWMNLPESEHPLPCLLEWLCTWYDFIGKEHSRFTIEFTVFLKSFSSILCRLCLQLWGNRASVLHSMLVCLKYESHLVMWASKVQYDWQTAGHIMIDSLLSYCNYQLFCEENVGSTVIDC